jgi:hypothetical protein
MKTASIGLVSVIGVMAPAYKNLDVVVGGMVWS